MTANRKGRARASATWGKRSLSYWASVLHRYRPHVSSFSCSPFSFAQCNLARSTFHAVVTRSKTCSNKPWKDGRSTDAPLLGSVLSTAGWEWMLLSTLGSGAMKEARYFGAAGFEENLSHFFSQLSQRFSFSVRNIRLCSGPHPIYSPLWRSPTYAAITREHCGNEYLGQTAYACIFWEGRR